MLCGDFESDWRHIYYGYILSQSGHAGLVRLKQSSSVEGDGHAVSVVLSRRI